MEEYLEVRVRRIGNMYHCRLLDKRVGKVLDEVVCEFKQDIGYCVHQLLRWHDKCGGTSPMAMASRSREVRKPRSLVGKFWASAELQRHIAKSKQKKSKGVV